MVGKKYWYVMSFRAQKSLDFQGPPLPMTNAPHNEVARLKANKYREILYTQHVP